MTQVKIREKKIWVDEIPIPLMGGEVHYWRLAPESWRIVLTRVKELGVNVDVVYNVATYICWEFHEAAPGYFDFEGKTDPRRNLKGFLDLLTEMGFWIIIRPGPYIYSEWSNAGVPEYAARYHRLDPEYLSLARKYLDAVIPVIQPYFATQGGRIILCQADNELDCWPHMYTEALGLGKQPGLFHTFLEERYGTVEGLNQAWGTAYLDFGQARAVLSLPPEQEALRKRYLDFYRFKHWYVLKASRWLVDTFQELGVDIPILMNTIPVHSNEPWAEMEQVADLVGTDLYPSNTFRKSPDEHRQFLEAVRYLRSYSCLPYISEFEAGIWHGAHREAEMGALEPNHYRMAVISALLGGAAGWNWYMLVERDNWYMSPINSCGRVRVDLFSVFEKMAALFNQIDPTGLEKLTEVAVTIDPLYQAANPPDSDLLRSFYLADIDYEFYDVKTGKIPKPYLFYGGGSWLDCGSQMRLADYVENGGHLICLGAYPYLDEEMRPLGKTALGTTALSTTGLNMLGIPEPMGIIGDMGDIALTLKAGSYALQIKSRWITHFQSVQGDPIFVERGSVDEMAVEEMQFLCRLPIGESYTIGFTRPQGKGKLTYLGLQPSPELLSGICQTLGISIPCRAATSGIATGLLRSLDKFFLCVVNLGWEEKTIEIRLDPLILGDAPYQARDLLSGQKVDYLPMPPRIYLHLPGKDATVVMVMSTSVTSTELTKE